MKTRSLVLVFLLCLWPCNRVVIYAQEQAGVLPGFRYTLVDLAGEAVALRKGASKWVGIEPGEAIQMGDEFRVGPISEAVLFLDEDTIVHLSEYAHIRVDGLQPAASGFYSRLGLLAGRLLSDVRRLSKTRSRFEVEAGGVVCGVRGTVFEVSLKEDRVDTATYEGEVEVQSGEAHERVKAGYYCRFQNKRFQMMRKMERFELEQYRKWTRIRRQIQERRLEHLKALKAKEREVREKNEGLRQRIRENKEP